MSRTDVFLLAAFLVLTLGSGAAWPAASGGHGGGSLPGGQGFGGGGFRGRAVPGEHDHGHEHHRDGQTFFVFPYFYEPYYYGYEPYYSDPYEPYDAHCDPDSPYYAPQYCNRNP